MLKKLVETSIFTLPHKRHFDLFFSTYRPPKEYSNTSSGQVYSKNVPLLNVLNTCIHQLQNKALLYLTSAN